MRCSNVANNKIMRVIGFILHNFIVYYLHIGIQISVSNSCESVSIGELR